MAGVADNITNINTVGYKGVDMHFRTLVTDGRARTTYSAGGVAAAPQALISKQGLLQASSSATDLGIDGAGFFVVKDGAGADSSVAFTRAGSFKPDKEGYLRNASGLYLQGWPLGTGNAGSLDRLQPVRLSQLAGTAAATTKIQTRANLSSTAAVTTPYTAGDIANDPSIATFKRTMDVYDGQGNSHPVTIGFVKTGPNSWEAEVYTDANGAEDALGVPVANGLLASGTVAFNEDGSLKSLDPALESLSVTWAGNDTPQLIDLQLGTAAEGAGGLDGLTQFANDSAVISSSVDGGLLGNISSISVSEAGVVSAVFDDGSMRSVFQLPIATFANPDGLARLPGNAYAMSDLSGSFTINQPGEFGAGNIAASSLEASNVDLAQEFTNMIRFQRAYSASSKIITTVDDMLQEVSNLKR